MPALRAARLPALLAVLLAVIAGLGAAPALAVAPANAVAIAGTPIADTTRGTAFTTSDGTVAILADDGTSVQRVPGLSTSGGTFIQADACQDMLLVVMRTYTGTSGGAYTDTVRWANVATGASGQRALTIDGSVHRVMAGATPDGWWESYYPTGVRRVTASTGAMTIQSGVFTPQCGDNGYAFSDSAGHVVMSTWAGAQTTLGTESGIVRTMLDVRGGQVLYQSVLYLANGLTRTSVQLASSAGIRTLWSYDGPSEESVTSGVIGSTGIGFSVAADSTNGARLGYAPTGGVAGVTTTNYDQEAVVAASSGAVLVAQAGQSRGIYAFTGTIGGRISPWWLVRAVYQALTPVRLLDTRSAVGVSTTSPIAAGGVVTLQVTGRGGVIASGVDSVVLNLTVTQPSAPGYVTVWPGGTRPTASNVNYRAGESVPNQVVVKLSGSGTVSIFTSARAHLIADVLGYYPSGSSYTSLVPSRLLDTRTSSRVDAGGSVTVPVLGHGGVPSSGVAGVIVNVTAVSPSTRGYLTAYPAASAQPNASNVNFAAGQTLAGLAVLPIDSSGSVTIYSSAATDLLLDVSGYVPAGADLTPLTPSRILDTRSGLGASGPVAGGGAVTLKVTGVGGVPATGVKAVILNVTAVSGPDGGYVTVYPDGTAKPTASTVNFGAGSAISNSIIAKVGADGAVVLAPSASTHLIADVQGYVAN